VKKIWRIIKKPLLAIVWMVVGFVLAYVALRLQYVYPTRVTILISGGPEQSAGPYSHIRELDLNGIEYEVIVSVKYPYLDRARKLSESYKPGAERYLPLFPTEEDADEEGQ
jgi:hypothetical protein